MLSGLLSVVGAVSSLTFLKRFPAILRARGWFGVHAFLACLSTLAALAMGAVMLSDSRKFARGYVIRSSLLDENVVQLHACSRRSCTAYPMWRPGQRRAWGPAEVQPPRDRCPDRRRARPRADVGAAGLHVLLRPHGAALPVAPQM